MKNTQKESKIILFLSYSLQNDSIIKVKAYNELADYCYSKLQKYDVCVIQGYINSEMEIEVEKIVNSNDGRIVTEKIVEAAKMEDDRLEQLRFVLEYQIKNLILEKTPIEEQIKNFESLHSDFYKRFNLLYTELLNIGDLIDNNQKCIDTYREELSETKKNLYNKNKNLG